MAKSRLIQSQRVGEQDVDNYVNNRQKKESL